MSRYFGPAFQVGYVVRDFEATLAHWIDVMGVGPFYLFPMPIAFSRLDVRGAPATDLNFIRRTALAYSGDTQIEIIEPGTTPSPYHDFLGAGRSGVHHVGFESMDFDRQLQRAGARGVETLVQGELPGFRFAYLNTDTAFPGALVELVELGADARGLFRMIKDAAANWDGANPVRKI